MSTEEMLDLVDENDQPIGVVEHFAFHEDKDRKGYIRGVVAFIQNSESQLWIPRRVKSKKIAPDGLDYSVAEHVQKGETYDEAIIRGFEEELNMKITMKDLRTIGLIRPTKDLPFFMTAYLYKSDEVPNYNDDDYYEYFWLMPTEIKKRIVAGDKAKTGLVPCLEQLFLEGSIE